MLSEARSIAFIVDAIHPQVQHSAADLQKLYATLISDTSLNYANLNTGPLGAQMMTVHGPSSVPNSNSHSALTLAPDRVQVKEEWPSISLDDFIARSQEALEVCIRDTNIPMIGAIQCVVRCLVSRSGTHDSREFFNNSFYRIGEEESAALGRPSSLLGLRMVFPPQDNDQGMHNVRIESFGSDPRSIFLEDVGVYQTPIKDQNFAPLEAAIRSSYDFLTLNMMDYLRCVGDDS